MQVSTYKELEIKESCDEVSELSFTFELDDESNNDETTFYANDDVYYKLYPGGLNPELFSTLGVITLIGKGLSQTVEETLIIARSESTNLSYIHNEVLEYYWIGAEPENSTMFFSEDEITFNGEVSGVLYVKYTVLYDKIKIWYN